MSQVISAPSANPETSGAQARVLTGRVLVLFVVLMTIMVVWIEYSVLVVDSTSFNSLQPSISAVFALAMVVLLINPALRWLAPRFALTGRQVILLYTMLLVGSPIASIGYVHFALPSISSSYYFQTPENRWEELFGSYRPLWACPQEERAIRQFWESGATGVPWGLWWRPLTWWLVYAMAMFGAMICLNLIIRRQWVDRERLTFPLVYLPLEMAREEVGTEGGVRLLSSFLRNPLTWIGAVVAIVPQAFAGANVYNPQIPCLPVKSYPLNPYFREAPWNAMGQFSLNFYPCLIGFGYLLTTEVSFSVWFFYLFVKLERVLGRIVGWTGVGSGGMAAFPFEEHQGIGAWLAFILFGLWIGRRYYADVFRAAFGAAVAWVNRTEAATYRMAILGMAVCLAVMLIFAVRVGLDAGLGVLFYGMYFIFVMALTRIRAEAGLGCISGPLTLQEFLVTAFGSASLGPRNLTALQHFYWHTVEFRGAATLMPCQLESFKMAQETRIGTRDMVTGLMLAILFSAVVASIVTMNVVYQHGGITLNNWRFRDVPVTPYKRLASWISSPTQTDFVSLSATLVGAVFMAFLTYMRINHLWWPFHPVGFAVTMTKRMVHVTWFPTFIAWAFKTNILRYGGYKLYRRMLPFFLGLVLGDFFIGGVFGVLGALIPRPGYCVFP